MSQTSIFVFKALKVIAWIIFVGLCIEAGGFVVNFIVSMVKPEIVKNLYQKLDLSEVYDRSPWVFFTVYSFILFIAVLKAVLFYIVVRLVSKMDLEKPFNSFVAQQILQISYYTLSIGILSYGAREMVAQLQHYGFVTGNLNQFWTDSQAFILMAAVIYIIATIFKRGIALQAENDLTI